MGGGGGGGVGTRGVGYSVLLLTGKFEDQVWGLMSVIGNFMEN